MQLHSVIQTFQRSLPAELLSQVLILAYIDDATLVAPPSCFQEVWACWRAALQSAKLVVEVAECKAWSPAATHVTPDINNVVPQSLLGLGLLGSVAE